MKYNKKTSTLTACSIAVLLSACGGSGSGGAIDNTEPDLGAALNTSDLDVPVMFDWSSDKQVALSLVLHDANGDLAANTRVSVYEMPRVAALDGNREPTDAELQQVAEIYTGYTDSEGRVSTTARAQWHSGLSVLRELQLKFQRV